MKPEQNLIVSPSPHVKRITSVEEIMYMVVIALIPATAVGVYFFGLLVLLVITASISSALLTEYLALKIMGRKFTMDGSAILTGLLLALSLPPTVPIWMSVVGAAFGIAIGKCVFGGLGHNIFNPALVGRVFLATSWPVMMTRWVTPFEAVTTATPLALWKAEKIYVPARDLFFGNIGGSIGETSALAILVGGIFLIVMRYIDWRTPLSYMGTVGLMMWLLGEDPIFHALAGGLLLGAFFMATDYVTTPLTKKGKVIFGLGAGIIVVLIRMVGGYPEGVAFSILLMNAFTPLIDQVTKPRVYGTKRKVWQ
ncbi:Na+-translocating ferredoxin:NAD+ oxidoreductase subunit D [Candidatus Hakubella thermalkaliphila]|uniref:Ion-translocating oxidoreductase complex subunit D n=1 Tax=Candidatus Hakubella thermalkaliphila TaxID=2754717 RepID=A0A6V8PSN2_9ACTN|nr:RnfABCDGE type electron transport complex subunit D [Candidatus Hakubella thermalkaliphila]GFP34824.1 Na+-translocating ferredoxin:NAD+ oxidoreductase subunit D [Candidatus Hakubella thermalkaliphila]